MFILASVWLVAVVDVTVTTNRLVAWPMDRIATGRGGLGRVVVKELDLVTSLNWDCNREDFVVLTNGRSVDLFSMRDQEQLSYRLKNPEDRLPSAIRLVGQDRLLTADENGATVRLWDSGSGELLRDLGDVFSCCPFPVSHNLQLL